MSLPPPTPPSHDPPGLASDHHATHAPDHDPSHPQDSPPTDTTSPLDPLAQAFAETQTRMQAWQQSYAQMQGIQAKLPPNPSPGLEPEIKRLHQQLKELELDLALTIVLSLGDAARDYWQDILKQESFWQFLRFAGVGFVLGLVVKSLIS